jgi:hypothetical protein
VSAAIEPAPTEEEAAAIWKLWRAGLLDELPAELAVPRGWHDPPRFAWVPAAVFCDPELKDLDVRLALLIGSLSPTRGQLSWASQEWLRVRLRVPRRNLQRAFGTLESRGHLEVIHQPGRVSRYRLELARRIQNVPPRGRVPPRAADDRMLIRSARRALGLICCFADKGGFTYVSKPTLARHLGLHPRTVQLARKMLEAEAYLARAEADGRNGWRIIG